jgi:hypothetical protein
MVSIETSLLLEPVKNLKKPAQKPTFGALPWKSLTFVSKLKSVGPQIFPQKLNY